MDKALPGLSGALIGAGLVGLGVVAACSPAESDSSDGTTTVSFSFERSAATLSESDGPTSVLVVLRATPPVLEAEATVEVVDAGSGTATPATDYAAFPGQTLIFPAGAHDGDSQAVLLDPLDDLLVDGASEIVRLRLQNPSAGALVGPTEFTATLTDIHRATVAFVTAASTTPDESNRAQAVALELDCGPGVALGVAASVIVSDLRTGSANSSSDYSTGLPKAVIFPAGRADGAIKTVEVQVVDDGAIESDETIVLGLSTPSATCSLGTPTSHRLTIKDDDMASGGAMFLAGEGPTGRENPLANLEDVSLGSQTVGAGPNTGTLVRVENGGGAPMALGVPHLLGNNPKDFAVEVESSSAMVTAGEPVSGKPGWSLAFPGEAAPVRELVDDVGPGLAMRLDGPALARIGTLERVALQDFPLPELGPVTLELERRPLPLRGNAKLVIDGEEIPGGVQTLAGDLQIWSGAVAGMPGSRVFLTLSESGARGFLELPFAPERLVHVTTDGLGLVRVLGESELATLGLEPPQDFCAGVRIAPGQALSHEPGTPTGPSTSALTVADCSVALESDFQFFQRFGSSAGLTNYVTALMAAVSDQYFIDVQTTLSIAYLGIHTTSNDGWTTQETTGANSSDLLTEFQNKWGSGLPAQANLAHFLSGAPLGGGVAIWDVLCHPTLAFAVSANLDGAIDWPAWTGQAADFTWDFMVVAHEIGHNLGSLHTHDYCPPLDLCWTNCSSPRSCSRGTLMSYCHLLCGGTANVDLHFHPVTAEIMRARVNASCLDQAVLEAGDFVQYRVRFNPLSTTGPRRATLEFAHDAPNAPQPFRVFVSGTAN